MPLKAFREDGTEVRPGDTISMPWVDHVFRAAVQPSNDSGTAGMIAVEGYPDMYSAPFGLIVREVPGGELAWEDDDTIDVGAARRDIRGPGGFEGRVGPRGGWLIIDASDGETVTGGIASDRAAAMQAVDAWEREHVPATALATEPAWESSMTGEPGDIQRDIRGPGGFWALIGPDSAGRWDWSVIDSSDGATIARGNVASQDDAKADVLAWEQMHVPDASRTAPPVLAAQPASDRSELSGALDRVNHFQQDYAPGHADAQELGALRELADAVRNQLAPAPDAWRMAGEATQAAMTTAPPVPGITRNNGCVVYSVLEDRPGRSWHVAAMRQSDGERVTWLAEAGDEGRLHFSNGHYHTRGQGSGDETLADLANRAGVFGALDRLSSGTAARGCFQDSHAKVLEELSAYGVGKARVRAGLLEAAALGYARVSWHSGRVRNDYGIRYDRVGCTFTWSREN